MWSLRSCLLLSQMAVCHMYDIYGYHVDVTAANRTSSSVTSAMMVHHDIEKKCNLLTRFIVESLQGYSEQVSIK